MTDDVKNDASADDWAAAMAEQAASEDVADSDEAEHAAAAQDVDKAQLEQFELASRTGPGNREENLEAILDIPVTMSIEIGRTQISIRNLLQLNQGSVVELDRMAGEPLDVLVNGTLVAHGEVVVVNEKFGIRLTDVVSAQERVKKLR
jgi:flagellar motor switch protein FliN/FliY